MRIHRAGTTTLATTAVITAATAVSTLTGSTDVGHEASSRGCTPTWERAELPAVPGNPDSPLHGGLLRDVSPVSARDVWFAGSATQPGQPWTLHWDGRSVGQPAQSPAIPLTSYVDGHASFDSVDSGWALSTPPPRAAGRLTAQRWHDGRWTMVPLAVSPDPATTKHAVLDVESISPVDAWGVGASTERGALVEHWDGSSWKVVPNPAQDRDGARLDAVTAFSPTQVWAAGTQRDADGRGIPLVMRWNGARWAEVETPAVPSAPDARLFALAGTGPADVWAVGQRDREVPLILHWDGEGWDVISDLPDLEVSGEGITGVYASSPTDVWFTGAFERGDDGVVRRGLPVFLHWDGTGWTTAAAPGPRGTGYSHQYLGIGGTGTDDVWAVGFFQRHIAGSSFNKPQLAHFTCHHRGGR